MKPTYTRGHDWFKYVTDKTSVAWDVFTNLNFDLIKLESFIQMQLNKNNQLINEKKLMLKLATIS